jgi:hypothetical protein
MTNHAAAGRAAALRVATEVRAELARQRKTAIDLGEALGMTPHTAGRRLAGEVPFDVIELVQVSLWLGVPIDQFCIDDKAAS